MYHGLRGGALTERAAELLAAVRIPSPAARLRAFPHQLSGGMRQRVVGAMAIAGAAAAAHRRRADDQPRPHHPGPVPRPAKELQERHRLAMIFVTHDLGIVASMCDRVAVMYAGRIVEIGPVRRIFTAPAHPYTRALLESDPAPRRPARAAHRHRGPAARPRARCRRAARSRPRCPHAMERCRAEAPPETRGRRRAHDALLAACAGRARPAMSRAAARGRRRSPSTSRCAAGCSAGPPGWCARSTSISFTHRGGHDARAGRRVGLRQDDDVAARPGPRAADGGRDPLRRPRRARRSTAPGSGAIAARSRPCSRTLRLARPAHARGHHRRRAARDQRADLDAPARAPARGSSCWTWSACPSARPTLYPHEFSGGQRQRIAIARALALSPTARGARRAGVRARRLDPRPDPESADAICRAGWACPTSSSRTTWPRSRT